MYKYELKLKRIKLKESEKYYGKKIHNSRTVFQILKEIGANENAHESLYAFFMNAGNKIIGFQEITKGGVNSTNLSPADIFKPAMLCNAVSVILAHNHPSQDLIPSKEDIQSTAQIIKGGKILGISVLDHIIFGIVSYHSFADINLI